jgi:hypothetical protein
MEVTSPEKRLKLIVVKWLQDGAPTELATEFGIQHDRSVDADSVVKTLQVMFEAMVRGTLAKKAQQDAERNELSEKQKLIDDAANKAKPAEFLQDLVAAEVRDQLAHDSSMSDGSGSGVRFDVENFFYLTPLQKLMRDVLLLLLSVQFVRSKFLPGRLWLAIRGSGQGLRFSCDLANSAFRNRVEKAWELVPGHLSVNFVRGYWRFCDDILILATGVVGDTDNRVQVRQFLQSMKRHAGYFKLVCKEVSLVSVTFLEVDVGFEPTCFTTTPRFTDCSLSRPLAADSAHPVHIHTSWPVSVARRLRQLSSSVVIGNNAVTAFVLRLRKYLTPPHIIAQVLNSIQHVRRVPSKPLRRLVLPFHPIWHEAVSRSVSALNSDVTWRALYSSAFGIESVQPIVLIAWANSLPHLERIVC